MKNKKILMNSIALILLALSLMLIVSCGRDSSGEDVSAPAGSTIAINPADTGAISMPTGTLRLDVTVYVSDANSDPLNGVSVHVAGGFAFPFAPSLYQMHDTKTGMLLSAPFIAKTGDTGTYSFYLLIPATISYPVPATLNSFTDTLHVTSGFATPAAMAITFN